MPQNICMAFTLVIETRRNQYDCHRLHLSPSLNEHKHSCVVKLERKYNISSYQHMYEKENSVLLKKKLAYVYKLTELLVK